MVRQKAIMDLALQFDNACRAKDDLRKAYDKCNDVPQESLALIDTFLKEGSDKDYELNLSMYGKAAKIEKQMNAKLIGDVYLTEKELHQLHLDEEVLRETLEEEANDEKEREEKIRQKQADNELFMLEFEDGPVMSTQEYKRKVVEDVGEDEDFKSGLWVSVTDYVNANGGIIDEDLLVLDDFVKRMESLKDNDVGGLDGDAPPSPPVNMARVSPYPKSVLANTGDPNAAATGGSVGSGKSFFADMLKQQDATKAARIAHMTSEHIPGANVAIPLDAVKEISKRFKNTLYGYFIGKRLAFPLVENYVKNAWAKFGLERVMLTNGFFFFQFATKDGMEKVLESGPWLIRLLHNVPIVAYSEIGLSLISSQLGRPIMLDGYTSSICRKSWGKNSYARVLVEVSALEPLKEEIVVAVPLVDGSGHTFENVEVEFEWQPLRCATCKIFDHWDSECPKQVMEVTKAPQAEKDVEGFTKVVRKNGKEKNVKQQKQVAGIRLNKSKPNFYYKAVRTKKLNENEASSSHTNDGAQSGSYYEKRDSSSKTFSKDEGINLVELRNSFDSLTESDCNISHFRVIVRLY
ncbi:zinc knuckle CX2CX4HX4C containing protein [Tanacetum coccineum]